MIKTSNDMKIATYDIEEWYIEETLYGNRMSKYDEYNDYLRRILDLLDEKKIKGTFFCVGGLVPKYSQVLKDIAKRGHEVGCHSNHHHFLNKMAYEEVRKDTMLAVDSIEQVIGKKVLSYRAPAFSVGESNKWIFEILAECGIERDSSIYPASRDFGGFNGFPAQTPCRIKHNGIMLKEFPICLSKIGKLRIAYSGGGYFRFFPYKYIQWQMSKSDYSMLYFHIGDLLPESKSVMSREEYESYFGDKGTIFNRYKRFIKTNIGKKGAFDKMARILGHNDFSNLAEANTIIDWSTTNVIEI